MGSSLAGYVDCSSTPQSCDNVTTERKTVRDASARTVTIKKSPAKKRRSVSHHPSQFCEYNDFLDVLVLILRGRLTSPTVSTRPKHECIYILALTTSSFLTTRINLESTLSDDSDNESDLKSAEGEIKFYRRLYSRQLDELSDLGLVSLVPEETLFSVLQENEGNMDLVLEWFQLREMRASHPLLDFEAEEEFVPQSSMFSPSVSLDHSHSYNDGASSVDFSYLPAQPVLSRMLTPLEDYPETEIVNSLLSSLGMPQYLETLVRNGYDTMDNLRYAQLDDLLALDVRLGHARRIIDSVKEMQKINGP